MARKPAIAQETLRPSGADVDYATTVLSTEVHLINARLEQVFKSAVDDGHSKNLGGVTAAIYAFLDYDHEPIYVGQTRDRVSTRVRRHLTGMRSDSVAKSVLDPFEVRYLVVWPLEWLRHQDALELKAELNAFEATVHDVLIEKSEHGGLLNEGGVRGNGARRHLPEPLEFDIIPEAVFKERSHPDIRLARRAQTIANLARHISERDVSAGLRRALDTQSARLALLARQRLDGLKIEKGGLAFPPAPDEEGVGL
ncbi:GIY-YIG nuclease family protein [Microbacterium wangruii]|uniref:GIY-YIG nuclease family protein n=1 Tax=Microbacterium wangruii TaxID=3049073 RepID=UPI00256F3A6C|nr:GIY-YIG nuclease family protein [Microbacterium sp. zg-Y1211]MDL5486019.1 GIY-YIG nuclease family protein [Microbacterium sp. zg-Y1211]